MSWVFEKRASAILYNILRELKINQPKMVFLIPSNVCPIVPATLCKAEMNYEFIDISMDTLCIDLDVVKRRIVEHESIGLVYVHNLGIIHPHIDDTFRDFKEIKQGVFIIDDRCPCRIEFEEDKLCKNADITLFSTGYAKYVEMGFGGCAFVNSSMQYFSNQLKYVEIDHQNLVDSFNYSIKNN